ncbi:uncharacterized protein LOC121391353 [Gigantopelta aegis]|uniref:uncharacterized protein LOC121391353 n=1 Tax=Gigantopelta aegis TaxID=1735272 RepID=UPI001B88B818|nr:uncharacterized protein LOC121391353 [Gigantopelta aegis]
MDMISPGENKVHGDSSSVDGCHDSHSEEGQSGWNDRSSGDQGYENTDSSVPGENKVNTGFEYGDDEDVEDTNINNATCVDETAVFIKHTYTENSTVKASFWCQLKAMLWRNILLKKRNKKQCLQV